MPPPPSFPPPPSPPPPSPPSSLPFREHSRRVRRLNLDWDDYVRIELTPELAREAGNLAELHGSRVDSIHLASGLWLQERSPSGLAFAAYDRRLHAAAALAGMNTYPRRRRAPMR